MFEDIEVKGYGIVYLYQQRLIVRFFNLLC